MNGYHRCFVRVHLDAIAHNIKEVRKRLSEETKVLAVVKTDAYGHGAVAVAKSLQQSVDFFAVATIEEAVELRENGIGLPILILGYTSSVDYEELVKDDISQTIYNLEQAKMLNDVAKSLGKKARVHIATDTGMSRIGYIFNEDSVKEVLEISRMESIELEGVFTHFSCADMYDKTYSKMQMDAFDGFINALKNVGVSIPVVHMCNSAGIMEFEDHRYDMVRSGIVTYGLWPSNEVDQSVFDLQPALEWKAHVVHVKDVPAGVGVSYGATYVTEKAMRIATVCAGYGDGYPRSLSSKGKEICGKVLIRGQYAPILGRVCMDQFMVDVSNIPEVSIEDEVTLIGKDGKNQITAEDVAEWSGRFNYELVCDINRRVCRIYE